MFFYTFLPKLWNMSLTASVVIAVVLLARLLLKKAPKVFSYALWAVVLFRLLCPVSLSSNLSLFQVMDFPVTGQMPHLTTMEYIPEDIVHTEFPQVTLPVPGISDTINQSLPQGDEQLAADPMEAPMALATYAWILGVSAMLLYSVVSYLKLRRKLSVVVPLRDNILIADDIKSPFVIGLFRPKIYLPCNLSDKEQEYIILHEQHHIKRFDHIMKALAFFALAIHWFNPLVWVAFILAGKDMEMSCDEAVIRKAGSDVRADYSASLLTLATGRRIIAGTPLAFGEGNTKGRIKNLAGWKKPAFWIIVLAVIACAVVTVCFLTNPPAEREFAINGHNISDLETEKIIDKIADAENLEDGSLLCVNADNFNLMLTPDFNWANDGTIRFFYTEKQKTYSAQLRLFNEDNKYFITERTEWVEQNQIFKLFHYLDALKYMPQAEIRQLSPDADGYSVVQVHDGVPGDYEHVLKYSQNGVEDIDGWYIHLMVQPLHEVGGAYNGSGDETIHLFYGYRDLVMLENSSTFMWFDYLETPDKMQWDGRLEINIPEFPGVTFRWYPETIEAITEKEIIPLYSGMPIWNTYFCDLTGDGLPELCSTLSYGSGMIDNRIIVYDYAKGASYTLEDRGTYDYSLRLNESDGRLYVDKKVYSSEELVSSGRLRIANGFLKIDEQEATADPLDTAISAAILDHYASSQPDGLIHVESHVLLANEGMSGTPLFGSDHHIEKITAYLLVLQQKYSTYGGKLEEVGGSYVPAAITFKISDTGEYVLEEYWEPRDGGYNVADIRDKFSGSSADDALNGQAYIEDLKTQCYSKALAYLSQSGSLDVQIAELLEEICASPAHESAPGQYIEAHKVEYQELLGYGKYTLWYCFDEFLKGGQTDRKGHIMALACQDIMLAWGEGYAIDQDPITGQDWFDAFRRSAESLASQFSDEELEKHYPSSCLLLQMTHECF